MVFVIDPVNAKMVQRDLIRWRHERVGLLLRGDQAGPVPSGVAQLGPGINFGLGGSNEDLTVDGRRTTKGLALRLSNSPASKAWLRHGIVLPGGIGANQGRPQCRHVDPRFCGEVFSGLENQDLDIRILGYAVGDDQAGCAAPNDDEIRGSHGAVGRQLTQG